MFTAENGKKLLIVFIGTGLALAFHQKVVAPMLAPKPKVKA